MSGDAVPGLLDPSSTALLVIDVQTKFEPAIPAFAALTASCVRLVETFRHLALPVLATEQYPQGLGPTVPPLRAALDEAWREGAPMPEPATKTAFSSFRCDGVRAALADTGTTCVLVCGLETHVCVSQTVHVMLAAGLHVHVAADAVASRRDSDRDVALRRMAAAGAVITTSEAAAFELLRDATHPAFRRVQRLYL